MLLDIVNETEYIKNMELFKNIVFILNGLE
jgi:hypothetical protein